MAETKTAKRFTPRKCIEPPSDYRFGLNRLSAASVPDRTGRFIVPSFAPDGMGITFAIDGQTEIVPEGKAESGRKDVIVIPYRSRESRLIRPGRAAVRR